MKINVSISRKVRRIWTNAKQRDKGYEPENIRWATYLEQAQPNNRRNNHSGRPRIGRVTVTVRLFPKTQTLLKRAAKAAKIEQGRYIEKVLLAQFEQEGIQ